MTDRTPSERYSHATIAMHWLMVLLVAGVYASINVADLFGRGSDARQWAKAAHFSLGLLVWLLIWVRLVLRARGTTPPIVPAPPARQALAGKLVHWALYGLMIAMPLLGWLTLSALGKSIPFFGLDLPALLAQDRSLARTLRDVHELGANLGYALIGLHAAAALFHHYVVKDNTLRRMSWLR